MANLKAAHDYTYRWDPGVKVAEESLRQRVTREDAKVMLALLSEACGVRPPHLHWADRGTGMYHWQSRTITLPSRHLPDEAIICHEFAHHLQYARPSNLLGEMHDHHGEEFCRCFREALEAWGVNVPDLEAYEPEQFTKQVAARQIAECVGWAAEDLVIHQVRRGQEWRSVLAGIGGSHTARWYGFRRVNIGGYVEWALVN